MSDDAQKSGGGSATGGGINFQAAVAACVSANIAAGETLGWFPGIVSDLPTAVSAETGGGGDDLGITLQDGSRIEAQVKKGLTANERLFDALLALAHGLQNGSYAYGALVVCPNASATIRVQLSVDLARIGEGRIDHLRPLARRVDEALAKKDIRLADIARRLRIVTMHCLDGDNASIGTARSLLRQICAVPNQAGNAWTELYADATHQIERRGRRTATLIAALLTSRGIAVRSQGGSPVANIAHIAQWCAEANSHFSIRGINKPFELDAAWIDVQARVLDQREEGPREIAKAIDEYHRAGWRQTRSDDAIAAQTIGRFVPHCVVVAGPGMGKSTLTTMLARRYSQDGWPVLRVSLKALAARMRQIGDTVADGLILLGLSGSKARPTDVTAAGIDGWILICDGLDETAEQQDAICQGLVNIVFANPSCRVIVTTRPIGYQAALLGNWRHYELLPFESNHTARHARTLIEALHGAYTPDAERTYAFFETETDANESSQIAARSPLLLSLMVSLAIQRVPFGTSRVSLYDALFRVYEKGISDRGPLDGIPLTTTRRFLDVLGWALQIETAPRLTAVLSTCAKTLASDLGTTPIRARALAEQCFEYWEKHGMLERLRVGFDDAITFVHRTFGEYSAARYLVDMLPAERDAELSKCVGQTEWHEVLGFAAALGAADAIIIATVRHVGEKSLRIALLTQAAQVIASAQPDVSPDLRGVVVAHTLDVVSSSDQRASVSAGGALLLVASRYPGENWNVATLLSHRYPWTRLSGWALAIVGHPESLDPRSVAEALVTLPNWYVRSYFDAQTGELTIGIDGEHELLLAFIPGAFRVILTHLPRDETADVVTKAVQQKYLWSLAILRAVQKITSDAGLDEVKDDWSHAFPSFPDAYNEALFSSDVELLECLLQGMAGTNEAPAAAMSNSGPLLHVSAWRAACRYGQESASDVWNRRLSEHRDAIAEVMRGIVYVAGIPRELLQSEATMLIQKLRAQGDGPRDSIYNWTIAVDVHLDLAASPTPPLSIDLLTTALLHPSELVCSLAAHLVSGLHLEQLERVVQFALPRAKENGLWVISALIGLLPRQRAIDIIVAGLDRPIVVGCEHLLKKLAEYSPDFPTVRQAARNSLLCSQAAVAKGAAELISAIPELDNAEALQLIWQAYDHWLHTEKPYPKGDGTIPASPREQLLRLALRLQPPAIEDLYRYARDSRTDVQQVAAPLLLERLAADSATRDDFVEALHAGMLPMTLLHTAVKHGIDFSPRQITRICELFKSPYDSVRRAAMNVLTLRYMTQGDVERYAAELQFDTAREIRNRAISLLP